MSYRLRIHHLEEAHENLKNQVFEMQQNTHWNDYQLNQLKREKLRIKDEIYRLQKLEQDEPELEDTHYNNADSNDY